MRKLLQVIIVVVVAHSVLAGCGNAGGDISEADIKRNAKAQADWMAAHPGRSDSHVEH